MEMPKDLKRGIDRQNKFMRNLMTNNVYTKTQCLKKQADFYNSLGGYSQQVRSAMDQTQPLDQSNYDPEISVLINQKTTKMDSSQRQQLSPPNFSHGPVNDRYYEATNAQMIQNHHQQHHQH